MSSRCNPTDIGWEKYQENYDACQGVSKWIVGNLGKSIELRHRIGSETLSDSGLDRAEQSRQELAAAIAPVRDVYEQAKGRCEKENELVSCIMAEKYTDLLRFFGPIDAVSRPATPPTARAIAPLQNGYVVTPIAWADSTSYEVMIDTAANLTILSHHLHKISGDKIKPLASSGYGKDTPVVAASKMSFDMDGVQFEPSLALVSPIVDFFEGSDENKKVLAILGADFLFGRPWEVNYDSSRFTIDQDVHKRLMEGGWEQIPLSIYPYYLSYYLGVRVYIDGKQYTFALDTAAIGTELNEQCFSPSDGQIIVDGITESIEGRSRGKRVKDARLRIGSREIELDALDIAQRSSTVNQAMYDSGLCGVLGTDVLRNFNYIYDPETMSLYLTRRRNAAAIAEARGIGFVPRRIMAGDRRTAFEVVDVVPGSGAEKAGIRIGDIVVGIASTTPDKLSMLEFLDMYYSDDPNLPVKVQRDGKVVEIIIKRD